MGMKLYRYKVTITTAGGTVLPISERAPTDVVARVMAVRYARALGHEVDGAEIRVRRLGVAR